MSVHGPKSANQRTCTSRTRTTRRSKTGQGRSDLTSGRSRSCHRQRRQSAYSLGVAMNRNTQRIIAGLLVFAMIAGIVIAIFASAADSLPL